MAENTLREIKRQATERSLARTTYELALERGFDRVTVQEITSALQLSRRTFSNYYGSKEEAAAAVLVHTVSDGLRGWEPPPGADLLTGVRSLMLHQFAGGFLDVFVAFRRLCAENPQLVPYWNDALWRMWDLTGDHLRRTMPLGDDTDDVDLAMVMGAVYGVVSSHFATEDGQAGAGRSAAAERLAENLGRVFARLGAALGPAGDLAVHEAGGR